jgi:adenine-specific DNA-methyltransferase
MKTVWHRTRHDAGTGGTDILRSFLGGRAFSFAKSLNAVRDTIAAALGNKSDGVVLDFFAGSGTTLHATALVNSADGGRRRCILIGNNELSEEATLELREAGFFPGDAEYEQRGVWEAATAPRVRAALTGNRPDGQPVKGEYLGGRAFADGFEENAAFFSLKYMNPDSIDAGEGFQAILPSLWLIAGAVGDPAELAADRHWLIMEDVPFAVLLDEDHFRQFSEQIEARNDITHVWLVTDSEPAFARMRSRIHGRRTVGMLYRDYLRNFQINTEARR